MTEKAIRIRAEAASFAEISSRRHRALAGFGEVINRLLPSSVYRILHLVSCVAPIASCCAQRLVARPDHATGIYGRNETIGWSVSVAPGYTASPGSYTVRVLENGAVPVSTSTMTLVNGTARIETRLARPGMVLVEITPPAGATQSFGDPSTGGTGRVRLGAAVDPTRIEPAEPRPADFDQFWNDKLSLLASVPINPVITRQESGVAGVDYYTVRLDNIDGAHIYGQLAVPSRAGTFPAVMQYQYAGVYPLQKQWVTDRAAQGWLAFDIEAHDLPGNLPTSFYEALPAIIRDYNSLYDGDRDRNYFLRMYLGDFRAVEFLASRAEWDGKTLVAFGESMGGQQAFVAAALNPRITHMVTNIPAGADANASLHGHARGYPDWNSADARVAVTAPYFDIVNFATRIRVPTLMTTGFIDEVTPPVGQWTAFNQIQGEKEAAPMIDSNHGHLARPEQLAPWRARSKAWMDALLHGERVPPIQPKP